MSGATPHIGAADVLWDVARRVDGALAGRDPALFVLAFGQENCFDRLHLPTLRAAARHLGVGVAPCVLDNYALLQRILFLDAEPTGFWLEGTLRISCGVPQG